MKNGQSQSQGQAVGQEERGQSDPVGRVFQAPPMLLWMYQWCTQYTGFLRPQPHLEKRILGHVQVMLRD